jgi:hypothetical protein
LTRNKAISGADSVQARRFAAAKALEIGWGGVSKVSSITGLSRRTIDKGVQELENEDELEQPERLRKPGGGRKKAEDKDPTLINDLEEIMKESTASNPMSLLKWTYKSTYAIAEELQLKGHDVIIFHELYPTWNYSIEPRVNLQKSRIFG